MRTFLPAVKSRRHRRTILIGAEDGAPTNPLFVDLVLALGLNEFSGTRFDSSVEQNNMLDNNTVTQVPGVVGNAAHFDLTFNEFLSIASNPSLQFGGIDFSGSCHVSLDSKGAGARIIAGKFAGVGTSEWVVLYNGATDRFQFVINNGTTSFILDANSFGAPALSTFYFLYWFVDNTAKTLNISVNDGPIDSLSFTGSIPNTATEFQIGANAGGAPKHDGDVDAFTLHRRILLASEVTNLAAGKEFPFA